MARCMLVLVLICYLCNFGQGYILLAQFHKGYNYHPGKCSLEKVVLNPPLPELDITEMQEGQVIGGSYDENKNHCKYLSCSLWKNHKGEGYRLENKECASIVKRPNNCSEYTKQDNRLPWPECCYFNVCPRQKEEL